jgi:hypothetical protein
MSPADCTSSSTPISRPTLFADLMMMMHELRPRRALCRLAPNGLRLCQFIPPRSIDRGSSRPRFGLRSSIFFRSRASCLIVSPASSASRRRLNAKSWTRMRGLHHRQIETAQMLRDRVELPIRGAGQPASLALMRWPAATACTPCAITFSIAGGSRHGAEWGPSRTPAVFHASECMGCGCNNKISR